MINNQISDDSGSLPRVSLGLTPGGQPRLGSGVIVATRDGIIQSVNNAICYIFGYKKEELLGSSIKKLMPKPIAEQHDEILRRYFAAGSFKTPKTRIVFGVTKTGDQVKLRLCFSYIENPGSTPMICAMVDEVEEHSFSLMASADGTIVSVEGPYEETCGYSNLVGANVSILCPASMDHGKFMRNYSPSNTSSVIGHLRRREMRHAAGHMIPISLKVEKHSEDPLLFGATITEIESSFEAMLTASASGTILFVDAMCALLFGYQQEEMVGLPVSAISPRISLKEGKTIASCVHCDGSQFFVSVDVQSFVQGGELCYRGIIRRTQANRASRQRSTIRREDSFTAMDAIDWYEVSDKFLGSGLCGGVKLATHRLTGIQVALKILRKKQFEEMQMFYPPREVVLLKGLRHPHIVRLLQIIVNPDATFLVMQKLQGGELLDYLAQQEHLSEGESRSIMRQIVMGVDFMHRCGIVHRDLKLENIIIDSQGQIKIIDLGLGNYFDGKTLLSTFCGSPDYAPPEIWLSQPYVGPEVDMWSLGVILYALTSGFMPFNGSVQIVELRYHWPPGTTFSGPLQDLVGRLLTRTKHRASMEQVLEHPWLVNGHTLDRLPNAPPKLDETILEKMESLGFPKESVKEAVVAGECNQLGAVYALFELQMEEQARSRRSSLAGSSSGLPSLTGSRRSSIDGSPRSRPSSPKGKHDSPKSGGSSGHGSPRDDLRDSQKRCIIA